MENLSKNSTNKELMEAFGEAIADGETRIFAKNQSSNPDYTTIFFCQTIKTSRTISGPQEFFLGWNSTRLVRAIHNAKTEIAEKLEVGQIVPFDIKLTESYLPAYEGQACKTNPSTAEAVQIGGHDVFEHTDLVEKGKGGVYLLDREPESVANVIVTSENPIANEEQEVTAKSILEDADAKL